MDLPRLVLALDFYAPSLAVVVDLVLSIFSYACVFRLVPSVFMSFFIDLFCFSHVAEAGLLVVSSVSLF